MGSDAQMAGGGGVKERNWAATATLSVALFLGRGRNFAELWLIGGGDPEATGMGFALIWGSSYEVCRIGLGVHDDGKRKIAEA